MFVVDEKCRRGFSKQSQNILEFSKLCYSKSFSMKTFDIVRICRKFMGILPVNANKSAWIMNATLRILWISDIIITFFSTLWFSLFDAENFTEFVQSFFNVLHSSLLLTWYGIYFAQRYTYDSFIDELETEIEKSECTMRFSHVTYVTQMGHFNLISM